MRDSRGTIDPRELARMFSAPRWLHDLGGLVLGAPIASAAVHISRDLAAARAAAAAPAEVPAPR